MVPTTTTVRFSPSLLMLATMRDRETGGRLILDIKRRRRTTLLKEESVRPRFCQYSRLDRHGSQGLRTGKEAVKLYQELEVDIVALGRLAVRRLDVVAVEIDTYRMKQSSA